MDWLELFSSLLVGTFIAFFSYGFIAILSEPIPMHIEWSGNKDSLYHRVWRFISYPFEIFINLFEKVPYSYIIWWLLWVAYFYFAFTGKLPLIF
jgi:hypothetical protein